MKHKLKAGWLTLIALIASCFFIIDNVVRAADLQTTPGVTVKVLEKGFSSGIATRVAPRQIFPIRIKLINHSSNEKLVKISLETAYTNKNGQIQYSRLPADKYSGSLRISQLIDGPTKIKLKAYQIKVINYTCKMPAKKISGVLAGAFYIHEVNQSKKALPQNKNTQNQLQLQNEFYYVIPVTLQEADHVVATQLKLGKIKTQAIDSHLRVLVNIRNITPTLFGKLKIKAWITKGRKVTAFKQNKNLQMAPLSNFDYQILINKMLIPGKYELKACLSSGTRKWEFRKKFQIGLAMAVNFDADLVSKTSLIWVIGSTFLLLLILFITYQFGKVHGHK
ncbi:DUF3324 domain-containing protein [Liquorilactobacillus sicerae]|uniref:DUF3324 domain-containing protein n=1 Tax=Liquorilactobacillus sicerae TaxID=1416943 RepID=UPI002481487D|nr:DUF3324 domain-containing protein [Liquorilactobacillus sicerae]